MIIPGALATYKATLSIAGQLNVRRQVPQELSERLSVIETVLVLDILTSPRVDLVVSCFTDLFTDQ